MQSGNGDDLSFEEAFRRLEETVARLESGGLSIDDMIAQFEAGMGLVKLCYQKLDAAQLRVQLLLQDTEASAAFAEPAWQDESNQDPG